jgi:hypothetical protein
MAKRKAWLLIGAITALAGLLLWMGLAIVVHCERMPDGRVDCTVRRRFMTFATVSSETVADVAKADLYVGWGRTRSGGKTKRGATVALDLVARDGQVYRRSQFGPAIGTTPPAMVEAIDAFIADPAATSFDDWWMPYLVNLAALPFLLVLVPLYGEVLLRKLGLMAPAPPEPPEPEDDEELDELEDEDEDDSTTKSTKETKDRFRSRFK